jgi:hypothetical protein
MRHVAYGYGTWNDNFGFVYEAKNQDGGTIAAAGQVLWAPDCGILRNSVRKIGIV